MATTKAAQTTPGDDSTPKASAAHPTKGRRFRVMGAGEGDFCIYQIAPPDSQLPGGCLIPIPEVPRFENHAAAMRWMKNDSGDMLAGKQVMMFCAHEIITVTVENRPRVTIEAKPKVQIAGPEKVDG